MKKINIALLLGITLIFSGCAEKITLDNIHLVETEYDYSVVYMNRYVKESEENKIITDAKEFASKFISLQLTRNPEQTNMDEKERFLYTEEYIEKNADILDKKLSDVNEFYKEYGLSTEVQGIEYKTIINLNGDAFVNAVAKVRLLECNDSNIISLLGYKDGINSNISCEYNIKMEYISGDYYVYDYNIVDKEGYLSSIDSYKEKSESINEFGVSNEYEIKKLIKTLVYLQNNRDYKNFNGDEDYPYLSESYKAELNKDKDDVKVTKELYSKYKINTEFINADIISIEETGEKYTIVVDVKTKLKGCVSNEVAKNLGYISGIGSEAVMKYQYVLGFENGELKLFGAKQI